MPPPDWGNGWSNVWLGTTTENQLEAARRIPHLIAIPAAVRFLSVEPMLEAIDLSPWLDRLLTSSLAARAASATVRGQCIRTGFAICGT
jgi:hypothetical protein